MMRNAITKVIAYPIGLYVLAILMPNVNYVSIYEIITVGVVLAAVTYAFDVLFLKSISFTTNAIIKAIVIGLIVWLSQFVFVGAFVSMWGAVGTGIVLGIMEYAIIKFAVPEEPAENRT